MYRAVQVDHPGPTAAEGMGLTVTLEPIFSEDLFLAEREFDSMSYTDIND